MVNKESDFRKFMKTMWAMTKYDVLPLAFGIGLVALIMVLTRNTKPLSKDRSHQIENVFKIKNDLCNKQR